MEEKIKKIHFIGIKGVGMTALAIYAKEKGFQISGSDISEEFITDRTLAKAGIEAKSFNPKNIQSELDLVIVSAAYGKDHPEVKDARRQHLEIKTYSEALKLFTKDSSVIAVAGIHGKTTTSALISYLLSQANFDPSFIIGAGDVSVLKGPAHAGSGDYFVLEADEYRKSPDDLTSKFFDLSPTIEIITSIEMDHPDIFSSEEAIYNTFYKFACRLPRKGFLILGSDYPKSRKLVRSLADRTILTYGFEKYASCQIIDFQEDDKETSFRLNWQNKNFGPYRLKIPGRSNVLNATAAVLTSLKLGLEDQFIKKNLAQFKGVKRRFEIINKSNELVIIDDYAHHPRAIEYLLESVKNKFPDYKIWAIFQPHTFSRTQELLKGFSQAFKQADKVIICDIYASAREKKASISGQDLALAIRSYKRQVKYIQDWQKIIQEIKNTRQKKVILTIGAGDIYKLANLISESNLKKHEEEKNN